jgi:alkaline phosphatase D
LEQPDLGEEEVARGRVHWRDYHEATKHTVERLAGERRLWTLLAQGVFFAPLSLDASGDAVFSDQWDGYGAGRTRLLDQLAMPNIRNGFVLSGDVHSFWLNDLNRDNRGSTGLVATEIVTSALAAQSPPAGRFGDLLANNPHIRFNNLTQTGYVRIDMDASRLAIQMRALDVRQRNDMVQILKDVEFEDRYTASR